MGHTQIQTTQKYLNLMEGSAERTKRAIDAAFRASAPSDAATTGEESS